MYVTLKLSVHWCFGLMNPFPKVKLVGTNLGCSSHWEDVNQIMWHSNRSMTLFRLLSGGSALLGFWTNLIWQQNAMFFYLFIFGILLFSTGVALLECLLFILLLFSKQRLLSFGVTGRGCSVWLLLISLFCVLLWIHVSSFVMFPAASSVISLPFPVPRPKMWPQWVLLQKMIKFVKKQ